MSKSHHLAFNYKTVNLLLAGIILCIFIYSGLFTPEGSKHPIPSIYSQITGNTSPSTGLSRSFSAIVRGNIQLAKSFNPFGLQIFLFFSIQLVFRIASILLMKNYFPLIKPYILADITLSFLGFLLAFRPLISFTLELFKKTIVS